MCSLWPGLHRHTLLSLRILLLWKIIWLLIPDFRLSDSPPGAAAGLLDTWNPETPSACSALFPVSQHRAPDRPIPHEHAASLTPPDVQLLPCPSAPPFLEQPSFPGGYRTPWVGVGALQTQCVQGQPCPVSRQRWQGDLRAGGTPAPTHAGLSWLVLPSATWNSLNLHKTFLSWVQNLNG